MKSIILTVAVVMFGAIGISAQAPPVKFDADLAKRLGGNDNGMKGYIFVMLRTGPNDDKYTGKEREAMFAGHFANIGRMADAGKLLLAGPFNKNERAYRGLFIFNVATTEEVQKLIDADPTIKNGIFVADVVPWYGSAAVMAIPEIHQKITKPKS